MKRQTYESSQENRILTAMIINSAVLAKIATRWEQGLFRSKWANIVGGWAVKYYRKYAKAPRNDILSIFTNWAGQEGRNEDTVSLVDKYLSSLEMPKKGEKSNSQYLLDMAEKWFNTVRASNINKELEVLIDNGDIDKAVSTIKSFEPILIGRSAPVNVLEDKDVMIKSFGQSSISLITTFTKDEKRFYKTAFERDGFIGIQAPDKRGKSYFCLDYAWEAMLSRLKVAYFQIGDLSEAQITQRFMVRAAKRPSGPGKIKYPKSLTRDAEGNISVGAEERVYGDSLSWQKAYRACKDITDNRTKI